MKKVFILGSTGSIGVNSLNVIEQLKDEFEVAALTVNTNVDLLVDQIKKFKPEYVAVRNKNAAQRIVSQLPQDTKLFIGEEGLIEAAASCEYVWLQLLKQLKEEKELRLQIRKLLLLPVNLSQIFAVKTRLKYFR